MKTSPAFDLSHVVVFTAQPGCAEAAVFEDQPSHLGTEVFQMDPAFRSRTRAG